VHHLNLSYLILSIHYIKTASGIWYTLLFSIALAICIIQTYLFYTWWCNIMLRKVECWRIFIFWNAFWCYLFLSTFSYLFTLLWIIRGLLHHIVQIFIGKSVMLLNLCAVRAWHSLRGMLIAIVHYYKCTYSSNGIA
jgi:hypothetical protein